ncbi:hypothetical protein QQ045_030885 [Rhodiola kirilowii]
MWFLCNVSLPNYNMYIHQPFAPSPYPNFSSYLLPIFQSHNHLCKIPGRYSHPAKMSAAAATFTPVVAFTQLRSKPRVTTKVTYISGLNSFGGLKAHNTSVISSLGLPASTDQSFAKIVTSLRSDGRGGGGGLSAQCNAVAEIFKIAAIMNGLTLVGVAVGFVLLRIEAFVEEAE